ncbi:MAG: hypothetical protein OJF51_004264 [Nitrospira sp.]|nr:MAG: hypothetical protein OJF51_004264 [Nitrospira sp.]
MMNSVEFSIPLGRPMVIVHDFPGRQMVDSPTDPISFRVWHRL